VKSFTASLVYTLTGPPIQNGTVTVDEEGFITGISESSANLKKKPEFFKGVIAPGFMNCHCHLELSHLKGSISGGTGIGGFIRSIFRQRIAPEEEIIKSALEADREMYLGGITALGDISNTAATIGLKKKSEIAYLTFVEALGFHPSRAGKAIEMALSVRSQFGADGLQASIVPHSPYSISDELFQKIARLDWNESSIISIHNQESDAENLFFQTGEGPIMEHLRQNLGIDTSFWRPPGKNSPETFLPKLPLEKPLLLVHNTFTGPGDLEFIRHHRQQENTWMVLCPNSNLYIENRLPPVQLFRSEKMQICVGTDSLASNPNLSILAELKTLHHYFPDISLQELLTWACRNGALAIGMGDRFGTLEPGKKPGIILITSIDGKNLSLTPQSTVKRLA